MVPTITIITRFLDLLDFADKIAVNIKQHKNVISPVRFTKWTTTNSERIDKTA